MTRSSFTISGFNCQIRSTFECRAEVVECDQETALAELAHGVGETLEIFRAMFEHFEHDAPRRQIEPLQRGQQRGGEIRIGERAGMHVQEQPFALGAEHLEIFQMQRLGQPVHLKHVAEARGFAEYVERRHGPVEPVMRPQQPFVADSPHMRQTENRLKHAA